MLYNYKLITTKHNQMNNNESLIIHLNGCLKSINHPNLIVNDFKINLNIITHCNDTNDINLDYYDILIKDLNNFLKNNNFSEPSHRLVTRNIMQNYDILFTTTIKLKSCNHEYFYNKIVNDVDDPPVFLLKILIGCLQNMKIQYKDLESFINFISGYENKTFHQMIYNCYSDFKDINQCLKIFFDINIFPNDQVTQKMLLNYNKSLEFISEYPIFYNNVNNKMNHYIVLHQIKYGKYNCKNKTTYNFDEESKKFIIENVCFSGEYSPTNINQIKKNFAVSFDSTTIDTFFCRNSNVDWKVFDYLVSEKCQPNICTVKVLLANKLSYNKLVRIFSNF